MTIDELVPLDQVHREGAECGTAWFTKQHKLKRGIFCFAELVKTSIPYPM